MVGDGGLTDVAGFGRPAHTPLVEDREEQLQTMQREPGLCHRVYPIYSINISSLPYPTSPPKITGIQERSMTDVALQHAEEQAPLEGVIKGEVLRMYQEVAEHPEGEFHFHHGRRAAEMFGYAADWLDRAPGGAGARDAGLTNVEFRDGRMEDIPVPDQAIDVIISNGVINLSFRKRRVIRELFRVLGAGGRIAITDIVSAKPLSQSIVNDPKLWAS